MEKAKRLSILIKKLELQVEMLNEELITIKRFSDSINKDHKKISLSDIQSNMKIGDFNHLVSGRLSKLLKDKYPEETLEQLSIYHDGLLLRNKNLGLKTLKELRYLISIADSNKEKEE
jgi:hypothetical protein